MGGAEGEKTKWASLMQILIESRGGGGGGGGEDCCREGQLAVFRGGRQSERERDMEREE